MRVINKLFGTVVAMLAMTWTVEGAEPIAVWSGFNETTSSTYTADLGSNAVDAQTGAVTLGSAGIKFSSTGNAWSGSTKGFTVAIKYSNFKSGTAAALVSLQQNSETTAAGIDKIGAWVNANGKVQGLWQAGAYGTANGTLPASGVIFVRYKDANGTSIHLQNGTLLYADGGLKSSNNNWGKSFAVGSFANGTSNVASGMTIEAVAIFDSRVSDQDMAAYEFPDPEVEYETLTYDGFLTTTFVDTGWDFDLTKLGEYEITGTMSGSSIANRPAASTGYWMEPAASESGVAKFQMQVYQYQGSDDHWLKAVEVELKKGNNGNVWIRAVRSGYTDGGTTDPKGSIKITNWNSTLATSESAGGYGVNKVVIKVQSSSTEKVPTGKVIAMNFRDSDGQTLGENEDAGIEGFTLLGRGWTNRTGANGSNISVVAYDMETDSLISDTTATITYSSKNTWYQNGASSPILKGYLDDGDSDSNTVNITATVPFDEYDLLLICSSDQGSGKYHSFKINNTYYYADSDGIAQVGDVNSVWGATQQSVPEFGKSIMRVKSLKGADGFRLVGNYRHNQESNRGCVAAIVFVEVKNGTPIVKNPSMAEISKDSTWSNLSWDVKPTASDKAELTVSANAKLTIDKDTSFKSLKLIGQRNLTIAGITSANVALLSKISIGEFSGKLTFEIDASAGLTADDALKNLIKTANTQYTFIFKSTVANKGATINYGDANIVDGQSFKSHIFFVGGTHTFQYRAESEKLKFGMNATEDNPTVWVKDGATLNFNGRNLCGWASGVANTAGIIRVDSGSMLNLTAVGGTLYWAQRFYIEPGAIFNFNSPNVTGGSAFRLNGGTSEATAQIYVPASDGSKGAALIKQTGAGGLMTNAEAGNGFAIFVGAGSALKIDAAIAKAGGNSEADIVKYGDGLLEVTGSVTNRKLEIAAGSFASTSTVGTLTLDAGAALAPAIGAPTVTGTFTCSPAKQLKLAIDKPTHMMEVITLPAAADKTGWTAIVNNKSVETNDLIAEGNTLKLMWKNPPTIELDEDAIVIEPADDWNGGTVMVDISKLNKGDYAGEGDIKYMLHFGDKTILGTAKDSKASFVLDPAEFTAGNIYRGEFSLGYGDGGDEIPGAKVTVYMGEAGYAEAVDWVNETADTFKTTGSYNPEEGAKLEDDKIAVSSSKDVVFTPNAHADYVERCDSSFTFEVFAEEAIEDDDLIEEGVQAGFKIVANDKGGVKFQFIVGDEWIDGPDALLNTMYEVTVSFHYAKKDGDSDTVAYEVKNLTQEAIVAARREGMAEKVNEIVLSDGTKLGYMKGTLQVETATPTEKGMEPGSEKKVLKAEEQAAADKEAAKIPVLVPAEVADEFAKGADEAALKAAKEAYKQNFKVVARAGEGGKYFAVVVPMDDAVAEAKQDTKQLTEDMLTKVVTIPSGTTEGVAAIDSAIPGFFYGVAENGEVVEIKAEEPGEWKMADRTGNVELKFTKPEGAKRRFYKVLCSPINPTK